MSCLEDYETNCECQYTLTLTNEAVQKQFSEMKDNFNHVPSIHEVDEEDTDEEHICEQESKTPKDIQQITDLTGTVDEDSVYSNESFCSDESCDEFEETNVTSRSFNNSHFSSQVTDDKYDKEDKEEKTKSAIQNSDVINSVRCKSSISEDNSVEFKQARNRRRNMSFTDEEMRKIEWENQLLLRKIMAQQRPKEKVIRENISQPRISSSAINRRKLQKKIENENVLLLQRIQRAKSRVINTMTKSGYRQTIL